MESKAAANSSEQFDLNTKIEPPGANASEAELQRWTAFKEWLAGQDITLEEFAMRYRGMSREDAARLASETTLRAVAESGTDEAAEEEIAERGDVRAEHEDG